EDEVVRGHGVAQAAVGDVVGGPGKDAGGTVPLVIRTRATHGELNVTPRKERLPLPGVAGASRPKIISPLRSKNSMRVLPATSTSVKTTPKPRVTAGVVPPGMTRSTSVTVLPRGV